jgi:PAS domain S-box-containing protein
MSSAILAQCLNRISAIATCLQQTDSEAVALELQQCLELLAQVQQQQQAQTRSHHDIEQALHKSQLCSRLAHSITINRIYGRSLEQLIDSSLKQIHSAFPHWRIAYSSIDAQGQLTVIQSLEPEGMPSLTGFKADLTIAPEYLAALRRGEPVMIEDVANSSIVKALAEVISMGGTQAVLDLPLKPCRNLVGLVCLNSPQAHDWREHEIGAMIEIADYLSYALQEIHAQQERRDSEAALHQANRELKHYAHQLETTNQEIEITLEELRQGNEELISSRQETERQRQRYQDLFNLAPDGYLVTDTWGVIQEANQAARLLLVVPNERQILNQPLRCFIPLEAHQVFQTQLNQLVKLRQSQQFEIDLQPKQGMAFSAAITVTAIQDWQSEQVRFLWLIRDISDKKRAELTLQQFNQELEERVRQRTVELSEANTQLQAQMQEREQLAQQNSFKANVLSQIRDMVVGIDSENRVTYWNRAAETMYGVPARAAIGQKLTDLYQYHWLQPTDEQAAYQELTQTGQWRGENIHITHSGTKVYVESLVSTLSNEQDESAGFLAIIRDISDRKQAEQHIRFQARLLDAVEQAVIATDLQGNIIYWNRFAEVLYGWQSDEVLGRSILEVTPASMTQSEAAEIFSQLQAGESWSGEFLVQRRDGTIFPIMIADSPIYDEQGVLIGIVGISIDMTKLKQAETALRENEQLFRQLAENIRDIFFVYSADLQPIYVSPAYEELWGDTCENLYAKPHAWLDRIHPQDKDRIISILPQAKYQNLTFEYRMLSPDGSPRWIRMRTFVVSDERGKVYRIVGIGEDFTDRKTAELALIAVSDRLQYLLTSSPAVIFSCPPDGDYTATFISQNVSTILGYEAEEFLNSSQFWTMHVHPDDLESMTASFPKIFEQGSCSYEYRFLHADRTYHWLSTQIRLVKDEAGNPLECVGYLIDVSERKRAEEKLWETQQHLQAILNYSPTAIYVIDRDNKHLLVSRSYEILVSIPQENLIGKSIYEAWPAEFADTFAANNQQVLQSSEPIESEEAAPHADGVHTYITIKFPLYDANGVPYAVCGISTDISDRKKAEAELQASQRLIQKIADSSPNLLYLYDLEEQRNVYVNREVTQMLGYTPEEIQAMGQNFLPRLMHPDDWRVTPEKFQQINSAQDGEVIEFEYRLRHQNGEWCWLYSWDTVFLRAPEGKPKQILGTATNISDRKQLELALQHSEERFRTCVENLLDPLAIFSSHRDATGQIVDFRFEYINPAGCSINRRSREDLLGKNLCETFPVLREMGLFDAYRQLVETGEPLVKEIFSHQNVYDGERTQLFFEIQAVKLGDGCMVTWRDITERKQAEDQIQASLKEKEVLLREIHHRVKNNLQVIHSLLKLQSSYSHDPKTIEMFQESQARIRSMALVHELLYKSQDLARIDFGSYIRTLVNQLARTYTVSTNAIAWEIDIEPSNIELGIDTALPCGLLINELVSNALKYAFPQGQTGQIRISLQACNNKEFTLVISDNGVGISSDLDFRHTDSLGLQLVCGTTEQIGGTLELNRTQGTTFTIKFREVKYKPRR